MSTDGMMPSDLAESLVQYGEANTVVEVTVFTFAGDKVCNFTARGRSNWCFAIPKIAKQLGTFVSCVGLTHAGCILHPDSIVQEADDESLVAIDVNVHVMTVEEGYEKRLLFAMFDIWCSSRFRWLR